MNHQTGHDYIDIYCTHVCVGFPDREWVNPGP